MSSELVGRLIADGRYEIVGLLGEGGMGAVYQARQVAMDRMVALKLIRGEAVKSAEAISRFQREMKLTAKIEHGNTIRVYDFGTWEGQLFLTMELLRGKTLTQTLAEGGRMPVERIVRIGTQVTRALQAAHSEGVVHRDLKPDNVMLLEQYGERDVVKVLDFGVAKSLDEGEVKMTAAGAVIGTPAYMSVEQAMGQSVDARSDLYSLGIMLFEMAAGRTPFDAPSLTAMLIAHATQAPPPLASVAPDVNPGLAALVGDLLQKDPAGRPPTAKAVEERLLALVGGRISELVTAPSAPATGPIVATAPNEAITPPKKGGKGALFAILGFVVVGGAVGGVLAMRGRGGSDPGPNPNPNPSSAPAPAPAPTAPAAAPDAAPAPVPAAAPDAAPAPVPAAAPDAAPAPVPAAAPDAAPKSSPAADPALQARIAEATKKLSALGDPPPPSACAPEAVATAAEQTLASRDALASDTEAATTAAVKAVEACPDWAAPHNVQGNALQKAGKLDEAAAAYLRALERKADYDAPRFNLGLVQLRRKDVAAITTFTVLIGQKPDYPDVYKSRAQAFLHAKRYEDALKDLEESVKRQPEDGTVWMIIGQLREKLERPEANAAYCRAKALGVDAGARCK